MGERNFVHLAEYSTNISEIQSQPETFKFKVDGCWYRYTPDFMVTRTCGTYAYVEIKDVRDVAREKTRAKLDIVTELFRARCEEFYILTDQDLNQCPTLLANIRHLKRYRTASVGTQNAYKHSIPENTTTIALLRERLEKELQSGEEAHRITTNLLANQQVWCDLRKPLDDSSIVRPMDERGYISIHLG